MLNSSDQVQFLHLITDKYSMNKAFILLSLISFPVFGGSVPAIVEILENQKTNLIVTCEEDVPLCAELETERTKILSLPPIESFAKINTMNPRFKECARLRLEKCFPNMRESIELAELKNDFTGFIKDPQLRYAEGGGSCFIRAYRLAYILAKLGIRAQTVQITHSPTLIAFNRDQSGELTGNYYDYGGYHTLIQVMVNVAGKEVPYLLDPQFMNEPLPRDKYFIRTTGQVCQLDQSKEKFHTDLSKCYFQIHEQNYQDDSRWIPPRYPPNMEGVQCGFHSGVTDFSEGIKFQTGKEFQCLNCDDSYQTLKGSLNESSPEDLIKNGIRQYERRLETMLNDTRKEVQNIPFPLGDSSEETAKQRLARLEKALELYRIKYAHELNKD